LTGDRGGPPSSPISSSSSSSITNTGPPLIDLRCRPCSLVPSPVLPSPLTPAHNPNTRRTSTSDSWTTALLFNGRQQTYHDAFPILGR
jgi:hypothetical protein